MYNPLSFDVSPPEIRYTGATLSIRTFPVISAVLASSTIIICYIIAGSLGHVAWWLPDITHCAIQAPERYIFRVGMIPAAVFIAGLWILIYNWIKSLHLQLGSTISNTTYIGCILGFIGGFCLVTSSSVLEEHATLWTIHVVCATSFFILTFFAQIAVTLVCNGSLSSLVEPSSRKAKMVLSVSTGITLIFDGIAGGITKSGSIADHVAEWALTLQVILYFLTFYVDFKTFSFVGVFSTQQNKV